ncbi:MAG: Omp28-related outer membrane protein [Bacteroidales bacterium]|nr:Omp28-related outer membrane protein [Bacteroidales bacterium]
MKRFYLMIVALSALAGCGEVTPDVSAVPELQADKVEIVADGADAVTFTVTSDGKDVTSLSTIYCSGTPVSGNTFSTLEPGVYSFKAIYEGQESKEIAVRAVESEFTGESQFEKHVALWEFTGAWCANCPQGYTNMNFVVQSNSLFKERVHEMAFHSDTSGDDPLAIDQTDKIMMDMNVASFGFPSYVVDMYLGGSLVESVNIKEHLNEAFEDNGPCCGVAVSSELAAGRASVNVRLFPEMSGSWRTAVYVVEDKVKAYQKDGMKEHEQYTHRHVVRQIVSETYKGDRIGSGMAVAGKEVEATYEIAVDDAWNLEETYVYVLAIGSDGRVNNMNFCLLDGGDEDYRLK